MLVGVAVSHCDARRLPLSALQSLCNLFVVLVCSRPSESRQALEVASFIEKLARSLSLYLASFDGRCLSETVFLSLLLPL